MAYLVRGAAATPATCSAAIQLARVELERHPYADTLAPAARLASDTLSSAARAIGTQCRQALTTQTVATEDLVSLLSIGLQLGDSSFAATVATRWIAAPQTQPADRDETPLLAQCKRLSISIGLYLNRDTSALPFPATFASVRSLVRQLDALGAPARKYALAAHGAVIAAQLRHTSEMGQWSPDQTLKLVLDFLAQSDAASFDDRPDLMVLLELVTPLLQARGFVDPHGVTAFYDSLAAHSPTMHYVDTVGDGFWDQTLRRMYVTPFTMTGKTASSTHGTYRYHAQGVTATTETWPTPGHVSFLITIPNDLGPNRAAMLQRLAAQYGAHGLTITVITKTHGYWLKDGPNTGPMPPAQEAAHDSAYYLGYLHLPVMLLVDSTTFTQDSEHRLTQAAPVPFEAAYGSQDGIVVLVDRTGHVIVQDVIEQEARLQAYLQRAFEQ
jgi:hypothetical protein